MLGLPVDHPSVASSAREAFRLYARYWFDSFKAPEMSEQEVLSRFQVRDRDNLSMAAAQGKGVIVALPHMGNWDVAGRWMTIQGMPVVTVAEDLRPERLLRLFVEHRRRLGMDVLTLGEPALVKRLTQALEDGRVVALVADRDLSGRGIPVEMFGRLRMMPPGPAALSLRTGAPLLLSPITTTREGWICSFYPPLEVPSTSARRADVEALTREIARGFEKAIAAFPADWHMFQPAWEPELADPTAGTSG